MGERWTRRRLLGAASVLLAYDVVYFCYHNLKRWEVFNQPRDQMLLTWDRWLFLGASYYGLRLATRALPICLCGTMFATVSLVGTSRSMTSRVSP